MRYVYAPDWSAHLNKASNNYPHNTVMLSRLGSELNWLYQGLLKEPLPEPLGVLAQRLMDCELTDEPFGRETLHEGGRTATSFGARSAHPGGLVTALEDGAVSGASTGA
jgi:hypothetical protein